MQDQIPSPNIKNAVRVGDFTLYVYAYRKLTDAELRRCAYEWLRQTKERKFPKSGEASLFTILGYDQ